jgi:simple sugar transport system permease protein
MFDISNFKNLVENTKSGYIYKTTYNDVATAKLGLDKLFPNSQVNAGILVAILFAIGMYILMNKTTLGYELKACGMNRHSARYAGIRDKRNIVLSMAIAGGLAGGGAALYYLSGNTEFFWSTYQTLPAEGFNGIPVALLGLNNPIGIIFSGLFVAYLNQGGFNMQVYGFAPQVIDIIISVVIYFAAFSLLLRGFVERRVKRREEKRAADGRPAVSGRGPQEGGGAE